MGLIAGYFAFKGASQSWRLFLATGILGGFTTFSSFSLDIAVLYERADFAALTFYVLASVLVSAVALFCGLWAMRSFLT